MVEKHSLSELIRLAAMAGAVESVITDSQEGLLNELADLLDGLNFFDVKRKAKTGRRRISKVSKRYVRGPVLMLAGPRFGIMLIRRKRNHLRPCTTRWAKTGRKQFARESSDWQQIGE
jgi:hypothetical protein